MVDQRQKGLREAVIIYYSHICYNHQSCPSVQEYNHSTDSISTACRQHIDGIQHFEESCRHRIELRDALMEPSLCRRQHCRRRRTRGS
jgi:hypothetical protein